MVPICICELSFFDYFIRIGNLSIIVYFLLYFIENKFLIWLRKEEEWTVIDRQMLDTLFDNNEKNTKEVPELEQEADESAVEEDSEVPEEAPEETAEAVEAASEEAVEEELEEELEEAPEEAVEEAETEASKILDETEIVDLLMKWGYFWFLLLCQQRDLYHAVTLWEQGRSLH